jgi:DNA-binding NtrC family response regulator
MPDTDGVTLLKEWSACRFLNMPGIMMSGHATIDTAVEATKIGALAFLEKPITLQKLLKAVESGLNKGGSKPPLSTGPSPADNFLLEVVHTTEPAAELPPEASPEQTFNLDKPLRDARDEFEKVYFEFHLARESGSMTRLAERTGLERTHLYRKLKQLGVDLTKGKKSSS